MAFYKHKQLERFLASIPEKTPYTHKFNELIDFSPIQIESVANLSQQEFYEIARRYKEIGFAVFELLKDSSTDSSLIQLSESLRLGLPFIPPKYQGFLGKGIYEASGVNVVSAYLSKQKSKAHHGFETSNQQNLHCDGTLEEIGLIKTSILLCVSPATDGGDTIIFNAVGAFIELARHDPEAAFALLDSECLRRTDVGRTENFYTGPAFTLRHGELLTRYSIDNTSRWEIGFTKVKHLKRAYQYLGDLATSGSPFYIQKKLDTRQGIIMANDKISHGRTAYVDSSVNPRRMLRGLFLEYPILPACIR